MKEEQALAAIRDEIDVLDYQIHDLINERAQLALRISAIKVRYQGDTTEFYRPQREQEILARIKAHNRGPLDEQSVANIFHTIIQACRELQIQQHPKGDS